MRGRVTGEQYAQIDNPDPFASPVWRSPVYRTPEPVIWLVQFLRALARLAWFLIRHPLLDPPQAPWSCCGSRPDGPASPPWPALAVTGLVLVRIWRPDWFTRWSAARSRCRWRWWFYRRHWHAVMTITGLAPAYRGRTVLPVLGDVDAAQCTDRVTVRLVSGQSPKHFADRAEGLAHGFRAHLCRVRTAAPGTIVLELVRRDALAEPHPALPIPEQCRTCGRCRSAGAKTAAPVHGPAARHPPADRRARPAPGKAPTCGA